MYRGKTFLILESDKNMMYNKINNRPVNALNNGRLLM